MSNGRTAAGILGVIGIMFSVPFYFRYTTENLYQKEKLTGSQMQRGLFTNNGVDGGQDPDWDYKTNTYKGYNKFKKQPKPAADDAEGDVAPK